MSSVILSWGKKGNKMMHIEDVDNGLKCNCVCPQCNEPLIARNRGEVRTSHFAHATDTFCEGAGETALHIAAKNIICSSNEIMTPDHKFPLGFEENVSRNLLMDYGALSARRIAYDNAKMEQTVRNFRPDILLSIGDKRVYVEITVTNKTKKSKILDFQRNGDLLFEIELDFEKDEYNEKDAFINNVLYNSNNRRWLVISDLDIEKRARSHEFEKESHQSIIITKKRKYLFSNNSKNFNDQLDSYLTKFTQNDRHKLTRFIEDFKELNSALSKDWRESRIQYLSKKDQNEIKKIELLAREMNIPDGFFAPRISNIWALDTHSKVWQFNFVNHFVIKRNVVSTIYLDQIVDWLKNSYPLADFIKGQDNLNHYAINKESDLYDIINLIKGMRSNNIPNLPSHFTIAKNYLDELVKRGLITHIGLAKYAFKDIS